MFFVSYITVMIELILLLNKNRRTCCCWLVMRTRRMSSSRRRRYSGGGRYELCFLPMMAKKSNCKPRFQTSSRGALVSGREVATERSGNNGKVVLSRIDEFFGNWANPRLRALQLVQVFRAFKALKRIPGVFCPCEIEFAAGVNVKTFFTVFVSEPRKPAIPMTPNGNHFRRVALRWCPGN